MSQNRFDGTPITSAPGAAIPITFTDPAKAGHTVDIEASDDQGNVTPLKVTLDASGKGSTTFTPPSGYIGTVALNGPDSTEHQIIVTAPNARAGTQKTKKAPAKKPPARSAAKGKAKR